MNWLYIAAAEPADIPEEAGHGFSAWLKEFLFKPVEGLEADAIVSHLSAALLAAVLIYLVYRITYTGVVYNKNFAVSIVIVTMVSAVLLMVINSNIALTLGMVGSLSIVRYRAGLKDPKDVAFIFWAVAAGVCAGLGVHSLAVFGTIMIGAAAFLFCLISGRRSVNLLTVRCKSGDEARGGTVDSAVSKNAAFYKMRMVHTSGDVAEVIYEIHLRKNAREALISELTETDGVVSVNYVTGCSGI